MTALWLRFRSAFLLWALFAAVALASPATYAYDGKDQTATAYDGKSLLGYDAVSVLTTDEMENAAAGDRVLLAKFAELLAAKSGGQLPANLYHYTGSGERGEHLAKRSGRWRGMSGAASGPSS